MNYCGIIPLSGLKNLRVVEYLGTYLEKPQSFHQAAFEPTGSKFPI